MPAAMEPPAIPAEVKPMAPRTRGAAATAPTVDGQEQCFHDIFFI